MNTGGVNGFDHLISVSLDFGSNIKTSCTFFLITPKITNMITCLFICPSQHVLILLQQKPKHIDDSDDDDDDNRQADRLLRAERNTVSSTTTDLLPSKKKVVNRKKYFCDSGPEVRQNNMESFDYTVYYLGFIEMFEKK